MCTTPCSPALSLTSSPSLALSARPRSSSSCLRPAQQLRHDGWRKSSLRVHRIQAFAGAGESNKEEAGASSQESEKSGAAASATKLGFGPSKPSKEKKKSATIRRSAPQQPLIQAPGDSQSQQIETAYVASLTFLGLLIFVEGLLLAASGFLPEEWDSFFVKTLYPSFTPTVGLFLLGAAGYGVVKYLGAGPPKE